MKKVIAIVMLVSLLLLGTLRLVHAASGINLVASPLPIVLSAKPGETVTTELRVKNGGTTTERLQVRLMKFSSNNQGEVKLEDKAKGDDYFDWVSFSPNQFNAEPNKWNSVKMTIKLPQTAAFGYYYAVSFSRANQVAEETTNTAAKLEGQLITFVLLEAKVPGAKRELKAQSFTANKSTYEFLPSTLTIKLKNTGNIHVSPTGNIFIYKGSKSIATLDVNPGKGNVLPNSARSFTADWKDGFPVYEPNKDGKKDKQGNPKQSLKWDLSKITKLRFGKYTAKMVMVYDDGQRDIPIEATVSFWVIPWRVIGVTLLIAIFVVIGLWSTVKKIINKIRKNKDTI